MRRLLLLLALMSTLTALAEGRYGMRYVKGHWLYQKGSDTNVIDMDLEWPDMIDGTVAVPPAARTDTYGVRSGIGHDGLGPYGFLHAVWAACYAAV